MEKQTREYILSEGQKVDKSRRFGFYRFMVGVVKAGYDPSADLMGDHHGRNV